MVTTRGTHTGNRNSMMPPRNHTCLLIAAIGNVLAIMLNLLQLINQRQRLINMSMSSQTMLERRARARKGKFRIRASKRKIWKEPGRTSLWWDNIACGVTREMTFHGNFRMSTSLFHQLVHCVNKDQDLTPDPKSFRADTIDAEKKVAVFLYYVSDQGHERSCANLFGISLSSVSIIVRNVASLITKHMQNYLDFPKNASDVNRITKSFEEIAGLPQIIGSIDGTHIPIKAPQDDAHAYLNYKNFHSINVMAVCDSRSIFLNVDVRWPGSLHDARVFGLSWIGQQLEERKLSKYEKVLVPGEMAIPLSLVADPAYPLIHGIIKEYSKETDQATSLFNIALRSTRNPIECAFGQLKERFRILKRPMDINMQDVPTVIMACFILHNFIKMNGEEINLVNGPDTSNESIPVINNTCSEHSRRWTTAGAQVRDYLKDYQR